MSESNSNTSTGSPSQAPRERIPNWIKTWWPVLILGIIFFVAGIVKYISPRDVIYSIAIDLIKAISVLMVAIYVVYTRLLAIETKRMAEASMGAFISQMGTVIVELSESTCSYAQLLQEAKRITESIHRDEKKLTESEVNAFRESSGIPCVFLKIKNMCGRRIEINKIEYTARHTGSDKIHPVSCDVSRIGSIEPWGDIEFGLLAAPEGEIEVVIGTIHYLDGMTVQRLNSSKRLCIERIRKPEKSE